MRLIQQCTLKLASPWRSYHVGLWLTTYGTSSCPKHTHSEMKEVYEGCYILARFPHSQSLINYSMDILQVIKEVIVGVRVRLPQGLDKTSNHNLLSFTQEQAEKPLKHILLMNSKAVLPLWQDSEQGRHTPGLKNASSYTEVMMVLHYNNSQLNPHLLQVKQSMLLFCPFTNVAAKHSLGRSLRSGKKRNIISHPRGGVIDSERTLLA